MRGLLYLLIYLSGLGMLSAGSISGVITTNSTAGLGNAVIYATKIPQEKTVLPKDPIILDQINLSFVPHVLPVMLGTLVKFPNSDEVRHNVFSFSKPKSFNLGIYPRGTSRQMVFDKPGEIVLLCNIHAEMSAYILVLETPHFATSAGDGRYAIDKLSAGSYTVTVWHERYRTVTRRLEIGQDKGVVLDVVLVEKR